MIKIGNTEVSTIKLGNTIPNEIKIGDVVVWPTDFEYNITNIRVVYSSGSQLLATTSTTNANYCYFVCDCQKIRKVDGRVVSTEYNVTATPSKPTYFKVSGNNLSFDFEHYGTTRVYSSNNTYSTTISYGAAPSKSADFKFENNVAALRTSGVKPGFSQSNAPAAGTSITYTGGTGEVYSSWTSGLKTILVQGKLSYSDKENSYVTGQSIYAKVDAARNKINVPSLATNETTGVTKYEFGNGYLVNGSTSYSIDGTSFTVGQAKNGIKSSVSVYNTYDSSGNLIGDTYTVQGDNDNYFRFCLKVKTTDTYDSNDTKVYPESKVHNNSWSATADTSSNPRLINSIVNSGDYDKQVNYYANTGDTIRQDNISVITGVSTIKTISLRQSIPATGYTLTNAVAVYSNNLGTQLLANGTNYCTFNCSLNKVRLSDGHVISTDSVIPAITPPSAEFVNTGGTTHLKFNFDSYKTKSVSSNDRTVTLKYTPTGSSEISTSGTIKFQGNSSTQTFKVNPDSSTYPTKIRPLNAETFSTVGASGATITYRGGYFTICQHWTSGEDSDETIDSLQFNPANNSSPSLTGKTGSVRDDLREIRIPSLGTTTGSSGSYSFHCIHPSDGFVSDLVIYQNGNSYRIETDKQLKDSGGNVISETYNIPCTSGSFKFYLEETNTYVYDSGSRDTKSAQKVVNTSLTAVTTGDEGIVSNITRDGDGYSMVVYYNANTQTYPKEEERINVNRSNSYSVGFRLIQAASEITYHYTLTTSVSYTNGNAVRATGTDYAIITCNYNKVRDDTSAIVETTDVSTLASITAPNYFTKRSGYNNQIGYNKSSYGTTEVAAENKRVSVSFANSSVTQDFYFSGNTATTQNIITQPISLNATTASAAGREISFTGGKGRIDSVWSSGERSTGSEIYLEYNEPFNSSSGERVQGYVINDSTGHKVVIPSLNKLEITSGTYNFSSTTITGSTFVITQSANTVSTSTYYDIYCSATTYDQEERSVTVGSSAGSVTFRVRQKTVKRYSSGAETIVSESDVANNSYGVRIDIITGGDEFITYTNVGTYDVRINYIRNTSGDRSNEASIVIGGNVVVGFLVNQE